MKTLLRLTIICLILLSFLPIFAQQNDSVFTANVQEVLNIERRKTLKDELNIQITSASKKAESLLEAPASMLVITAEDIRRRGYTDLEQVFHDLPGFDVSRGNGNDYATIFQRGYRSNNIDRMLMLVDGLEENDLWRGNIWLSRQYSLSNVERIEIIYGAASTIYGANAFAGTINIITKNNIFKSGKKIGVTGSLNYGSWNTALADLTVAGRYKSAVLTVTGRYFKSNEMDFSKFADYDFNLEQGDVWKYDLNYYKTLMTVPNSSSDFKNLSDALQRNPALSQLYTISADRQSIVPTDLAAQRAKDLDKNLTDSVLKLPNATLNPDYAEDWLVYAKLKIDDFTFGVQTWRRNEGQNGWYAENKMVPLPQATPWVPAFSSFYANYNKKINNVLTFSLLNNYRIHELEDERVYNMRNYLRKSFRLRDLVNNRKPFLEYRGFYVISKQFRSEGKLLYQPSPKFSLITGLEWRNSMIQGDYVIGSGEYASETGTVNTSFPEGNHFNGQNYAFYAQGKYEILKNLLFTFGGRLDHNRIRTTGGFGWAFNPRIALVYNNEKWTFKAIYAEAFKDADFWQRYSTTTTTRRLNNPSLEPEKVRNIDLNIGWHPTENLYVSATGYYAHYSGAVGLAVVPFQGGTTTQNQAVGEYVMTGLQATATYKLSKNYFFNANYTYCNPQNTKDLEGKDANLRIGDIASHRLNVEANGEFFSKLNVNLRLNYVGNRQTGAGTTIATNPLTNIDAYTTLHTTIGYSNFLVKGLSLQFTVQNILDNLYYHPGLRTADGIEYTARVPQPPRNFMARALFDF